MLMDPSLILAPDSPPPGTGREDVELAPAGNEDEDEEGITESDCSRRIFAVGAIGSEVFEDATDSEICRFRLGKGAMDSGSDPTEFADPPTAVSLFCCLLASGLRFCITCL